MTITAVANRNRRVALIAFGIALGTLGLGFASVPLYRIFCEYTGFDGTTQRIAEAGANTKVTGKIINVRFDANTAPTLPWTFKPDKEVMRVAVGARQLAFFTAENVSDYPITGTAVFNVTPQQSGKYFTKIQCFCFTEQTLKPGERVRMPVIFYVDPKFIDDPDTHDISEITLSYTFYPVDSGKVSG
jgi:cytochrome c oxidase assembly protein subunit 11